MRLSVCLCLALITTGCGSSVPESQSPERALQSAALDGTINICAPSILFGAVSRSPSLYVNGEKMGKPAKNQPITVATNVGDKWELKLEKNPWALGPAQFEDLIVASGETQKKGDRFILLQANANWGDALGALGASSGSIIGAALAGGTGGLINSKNGYEPFTATILDQSGYEESC